MGKVLTPLLTRDGADGRDLPGASTLCGACTEACPVEIPLADLLVRLRADLRAPGLVGRRRPVRATRRPDAGAAGTTRACRARASRLPGAGAPARGRAPRPGEPQRRRGFGTWARLWASPGGVPRVDDAPRRGGAALAGASRGLDCAGVPGSARWTATRDLPAAGVAARSVTVGPHASAGRRAMVIDRVRCAAAAENGCRVHGPVRAGRRARSRSTRRSREHGGGPGGARRGGRRPADRRARASPRALAAAGTTSCCPRRPRRGAHALVDAGGRRHRRRARGRGDRQPACSAAARARRARRSLLPPAHVCVVRDRPTSWPRSRTRSRARRPATLPERHRAGWRPEPHRRTSRCARPSASTARRPSRSCSSTLRPDATGRRSSDRSRSGRASVRGGAVAASGPGARGRRGRGPGPRAARRRRPRPRSSASSRRTSSARFDDIAHALRQLLEPEASARRHRGVGHRRRAARSRRRPRSRCSRRRCPTRRSTPVGAAASSDTPDGTAVVGWPDLDPSPRRTAPSTLLLLADPFTFPVDGVPAPAQRGPARAHRHRRARVGRAGARAATGSSLDDAIVDATARSACSSTASTVRHGRVAGLPADRAARSSSPTRERNFVEELGGQPALDRLAGARGERRPTTSASCSATACTSGSSSTSTRPSSPAATSSCATSSARTRRSGALAVGDQRRRRPDRAVPRARRRRRRRGPARAARRRRGRRAALLFTCNGRGRHLFGVPDHDAGLVDEHARPDPGRRRVLRRRDRPGRRPQLRARLHREPRPVRS